MGRNITIASLSIFFAILVGVVITFAYNDMQERRLEKLDTKVLQEYIVAKNSALKVASVYSVDSQKKYDSMSRDLRMYMTDSLWEDFFSSTEYLGEKKNFSIAKENVVGENLGGGQYIIKMDIVLTTETVSTYSTLLFHVDSGLVSKIERVGGN